jgi:hypothetical protein
MIAVVGSIQDNGFIKEQNAALVQLELKLTNLKKELKLK